MIPLWIAASVLAGFSQALRTAMQQNFRDLLTTNGAAMVRHLFGLPFVVLATVLYLTFFNQQINYLSGDFIVLAIFTAVCQIFGTLALIHSFTERGYLVGTAFAKTEAVQAAVAAAIIFDERLNLLTWSGISLGVLGVLLVAVHGRKLTLIELVQSLRQPAAGYGLAAAALLAATGLIGKEATAALPVEDPTSAALLTVACVMFAQCIFQGGWMLLRDFDGLKAICIQWRHSTQIGLVSALGSIFWFVAIALAPVALVRIVGQSEVIFTMCFSCFYLKERAHASEIIGLLLIGAGVIFALLGTW